MRRVLCFLLSAFCFPGMAAAAAEPSKRPLVYVIVIDGLDGDRVDSGGAPFIKSMLEGREGAAATYFRESRSTMIAETNPNHVSMATGAYGDRSGIPGNAFAVYGDASAGCPPAAGPQTGKPAQTSGEDPSCLDAQTVFESLERQGGDSVTTSGIFGKPKLGRLFAGKRPDGRHWADRLWAPCEDPGDDTPYCRQVAINPATRYAADDSVVMDEVIRAAPERADFTFVNLPQVDSAGHATGAGPVYDRAIELADAQIERFVESQRSLGLWGRRTVLLLVSDHSMDTTPEKTSLAERFRAAGIDSGDYLIVQNGSASLVYLADRAAPGRFDLLKRMRAAALGAGSASAEVSGTGPVGEALYREPNPADGGHAHTLDTVHPAWRLAGPRTGDLVVTHDAGGAFSDPFNPLAGNHGGPQTRDNFMAVIGPRDMVQQALPPGEATAGYDDTERNPRQSENVDVAPTVARLLGFGPPRDSRGRILGESLHAAGLPPAPTLRVAASPRRVRAGRSVALTIRVTLGAAAVEGARVRLGNLRATTDASGVARLRGRIGVPGLRRMVATRSGYRAGTGRVRVLARR
jgi:hypothetical protein